MKYFFIVLFITIASTAFAQERMIWKIVWPTGIVLEMDFPSISMCEKALKSSPKGSTCVARPKSN